MVHFKYGDYLWAPYLINHISHFNVTVILTNGKVMQLFIIMCIIVSLDPTAGCFACSSGISGRVSDQLKWFFCAINGLKESKVNVLLACYTLQMLHMKLKLWHMSAWSVQYSTLHFFQLFELFGYLKCTCALEFSVSGIEYSAQVHKLGQIGHKETIWDIVIQRNILIWPSLKVCKSKRALMRETRRVCERVTEPAEESFWNHHRPLLKKLKIFDKCFIFRKLPRETVSASRT